VVFGVFSVLARVHQQDSSGREALVLQLNANCNNRCCWAWGHTAFKLRQIQVAFKSWWILAL